MDNKRSHDGWNSPTEMIFVNRISRENQETIQSKPTIDYVDFEIILLGPNEMSRRQYKSETKRRKVRSDEAKSKSSSEKSSDKDKEDVTVSQQETKKKQSIESPQTTENLLKQMEKRYKDNLVPDDNTYVDYLDYF